MKNQDRIVRAGFPHHVVMRGNNRRRLFSYPNEYRQFLWIVSRALRSTGCELHEITLMTNHVHLMVRPPNSTALPRFIQIVAQQYALWRNKRRGTTGKLWEQRFFSEPLLDEQHVALVSTYIHLNAVRAGMVRHPAAYRWTTYGYYAGCPERSAIHQRLITPSDWYLGLGRDARSRALAYREWVMTCRERDWKPGRVRELQRIEALSEEPYTRRLERPDRTRAAEAECTYAIETRGCGQTASNIDGLRVG
jgi:putative transposase